MAELIDANTAKQMLGCDDATLSNYINNGTVRAQRVNGVLMLNQADVSNLAKGGKQSDSDDGTIILSGDSEEMSIDLGEVIDDSAVTMVQPQVQSASAANPPTESITFGEDLEVPTIEADKSEQVSFDETGATANLNFTDEQTVVLGSTEVDETGYQTAAGSTNAISSTDDFQTVSYDDAPAEGSEEAVGAGVRRSIRSQRIRTAPTKTHWIFPVVLFLTMGVIVFLIIPYYILHVVPRTDENQEGNPIKQIYKGIQTHFLGQKGTVDGAWTDLASNVAGVTIEPDKTEFMRGRPKEDEAKYKSIDQAPNHKDVWYYQWYLGPFQKKPKEEAKELRRLSLIIQEAVSDTPETPPSKAKAKDDKGADIATYEVREQPDDVGGNPEDAIKTRYPDLRYPQQ